MDYLPNGSLLDLMKREQILSIRLAKHYAAEIVQALIDLREHEIVHRDLKLGNIMLD
jgi:serine/threonine protein kinase